MAAALVERVVVQQHLRLGLQAAQLARQRVAVGVFGQPEVGVAADHALQRGGAQAVEFAVAGVPAGGRAPLQRPAVFFKKGAQGVQQGPRFVLAQAQAGRVEQGEVVAAHQPVAGAEQGPAAVGGQAQAILGGPPGGPGLQAIGLAPAQLARQQALVRHRQGVFVAFEAGHRLQAAQQGALAGQGGGVLPAREGVLAGLGQAGRERDHPVSGRIGGEGHGGDYRMSTLPSP